LLSGVGGFLSGPAAISSSLGDVKRHLIATFAGLQASLRQAVTTFDPKEIDTAVSAKGGLLKSKHALQAAEIEARHADLSRQLEGEEGTLDRAFVQAYAAAEQSK
jgi:predicted component of type VI protein secretion system